MAETSIPSALKEALAALWRIPRPGPRHLSSDPCFVRLHDACCNLYYGAKSKEDFGLHGALLTALRALGLPCGLVPENAHLALSVDMAASRLDAAFRQTQVRRVYLCPLDRAGDLPTMKFGPNSIRKFDTDELEALVEPLQLKRFNSNWTFDAKRFSKFYWMVVEETRDINSEPGERASPELHEDLSDLDLIKSHQEQFPTVVERALFAVLLLPWEDWVERADDWRGFRVPWLYPLSDDIFVHPSWPPSPLSPA
jgi:hypothetical protein